MKSIREQTKCSVTYFGAVPYRPRTAATVLELLVVVAIVAILIGLLVVGIVQVREAAARSQSKNNLKQIILAVHGFASANKGEMPLLGDYVTIRPNGLPDTLPAPALFVRLRPFLEQQDVPASMARREVLKVLISPADPTASLAISQGDAPSSYAANGEVFNNRPRLPVTFADGASNTIAFAEHYAKCGSDTFQYWNASGAWHRPAFADYGDVVPVTSGNPAVTSPQMGYPPVEIPATYQWRTFQVAPAVTKCYSAVAQTPHPSGMLIALADGSVRQISGGISETTFWAAVTPAGNDGLGADW